MQWVGRSRGSGREGVRHLLARRTDPNLLFLPPPRPAHLAIHLCLRAILVCVVERKLGRERWNRVLCNSIPLDHSY